MKERPTWWVRRPGGGGTGPEGSATSRRAAASAGREPCARLTLNHCGSVGRAGYVIGVITESTSRRASEIRAADPQAGPDMPGIQRLLGYFWIGFV